MKEHLRIELINVATHAFGLLGALTITSLLLMLSAKSGEVVKVVSFAVFGASIILLYFASTLFHLIPTTSKVRPILQKLDHAFIFVMIAGTYTPFCLIALYGPWGWSLLGVLWGFTVIGISTKLLWKNMPPLFSAGSYLALGWVGTVAFLPLYRVLGGNQIILLIIGGLFYTLGVVCYRLDRHIAWGKYIKGHELFHICVLLGSTSHVILMFKLLFN